MGKGKSILGLVAVGILWLQVPGRVQADSCREAYSSEHVRLLQIAAKRGLLKVFTADVQGVKKSVTLLVSSKPDALSRALTPYYQNYAGGDFPGGSQATAERTMNALKRYFGFFTGLIGRKSSPIDEAAANERAIEDEWINQQASQAVTGQILNIQESTYLPAGYRKSLIDYSQFARLVAARVIGLGFYATIAANHGIPHTPAGQALLLTFYAAPEVINTYVAAEVLLSVKYRSTPAYQFWFFLKNAQLIKQANQMWANFRSRFLERPNVSQIFVVLAPDQAKSIEDRLVGEGFKNQDLDQLLTGF